MVNFCVVKGCNHTPRNHRGKFFSIPKERCDENDHLIKIFEAMEEIYSIINDEFRCLAYKVISNLFCLFATL